MTFFAIQVQTGKEIFVKSFLEEILQQNGETSVKSIYAMESYTQVVNNRTDSIDLTNITSEEITSHLYAQRLQSSLNNLRLACEKLKRHQDNDSLNLIQEYRSNIKHITNRIKKIKDSTRKVSSVLPGYILIELDSNYQYLPAHLWHLIKGVPKVIAIPSNLNIPHEEIDLFFQKVDLSPEVEIQLEEALSHEEVKEIQDKTLHEINSNPSANNKDLIRRLDNVNSKVVCEVESLKKPNSVMKRVRAFIKNKRKTVSMPSQLFLYLFEELRFHKDLPTFPSNENELVNCIKKLESFNMVALE